MGDQPTPQEKQYAEGIESAIELLSAIVEAFEDNGDEPDATLAEYIAAQKIGSDIAQPVWDLLGGLANLSHLLLGAVEELGKVTKQEALDRLAARARTIARRGTNRPPDAT